MSEWRGLRPPSAVGATVVDSQMFRFLVDLEVQKAQRLRYCLSLVGLELPPSGTREPSTPSIAGVLTREIRGTDVVAPWVSDAIAILLIDAETTHLPSILGRLTARLGPTTWSAGGSCYPKTATRADDMLRQALDSMVRARDSGGNRLYVGS